MSEDLKQAERYRKKAAELRAMASEDKNPDTRALLVQVACNYEQLALNVETIHRVSAVLRERRISNCDHDPACSYSLLLS